MSVAKLSELFAKIPRGPWVLVRRAAPGWRVETAHGGELVAYGPEKTNDAWTAQLLVRLRDEWPDVVAELHSLRGDVLRLAHRLADSEREREDLARRNSQLVEFVIDAAEYFEEWGEPDWFLLRARELTSGADRDAGVRAGSSVPGREP